MCMYPPPHVTCMYPPPHMTCMYPPPHVTCMCYYTIAVHLDIDVYVTIYIYYIYIYIYIYDGDMIVVSKRHNNTSSRIIYQDSEAAQRASLRHTAAGIPQGGGGGEVAGWLG